MLGAWIESLFPSTCSAPAAEMIFTIVPLKINAEFFTFPQCLLLLLFEVLVFLQMGKLGVIFLKESLLYTR